ncbi:MAG: inositol monophosphatase family protein [Dermatophilaceae bacterium]
MPRSAGPTSVPGIPLPELEQLAVEVATLAGRYVVEQRPAGLTSASTKSSDTDVVTVMDTGAEALIRAQLRSARPEDGLLGEEGARQAGSSGISWVVDPIDGTVNYLYELPLYAVSVAAVEGDPQARGWRPVAGAVCAPGHGAVWSAHRDGGARVRSLDRQPEAARGITVGTEHDLAHALVGTGFSYLPRVRTEQAQVLAQVLPHVRDIRRLGSAATDLCLVADGRLDAFYERCLNPWDLAAGWLIVTEAGGLVTGTDGNDPGPDLVVAANRVLHPQLMGLLGPGPAPPASM